MYAVGKRVKVEMGTGAGVRRDDLDVWFGKVSCEQEVSCDKKYRPPSHRRKATLPSHVSFLTFLQCPPSTFYTQERLSDSPDNIPM